MGRAIPFVMVQPDGKNSRPKTPAQILRMNAILFAFLAVICLGVMADCDATGDHYYFRFFALAFMFVAASVVTSGYLTIRGAWKGEPPADPRDGIIPASIIFAPGWGIWTLVHYLET